MKMLRITLEGKTYEVGVEVLDGSAPVQSAPAVVAPVAASAAPAAPAPVAPAATGTGTPVTAPMAGILLKFRVKVGDAVAVNQEVAVLEAMKMETALVANVAGTIQSIAVAEKASVTEGQVILTIG